MVAGEITLRIHCKLFVLLLRDTGFGHRIIYAPGKLLVTLTEIGHVPVKMAQFAQSHPFGKKVFISQGILVHITVTLRRGTGRKVGPRAGKDKRTGVILTRDNPCTPLCKYIFLLWNLASAKCNLVNGNLCQRLRIAGIEGHLGENPAEFGNSPR